MNNLLTTSLIALNIFSFDMLSIRAQDVVETELKTGRTLTVELSKIKKIDCYSDYLLGRPNQYLMGMNGDAVMSIIH